MISQESSVWFDLYIAGWGPIVAIFTGIIALSALYHPSLLESGTAWMDGPWYAKLMIQIIAFWFSVGGVLVGYEILRSGLSNAIEKKNP